VAVIQERHIDEIGRDRYEACCQIFAERVMTAINVRLVDRAKRSLRLNHHGTAAEAIILQTTNGFLADFVRSKINGPKASPISKFANILSDFVSCNDLANLRRALAPLKKDASDSMLGGMFDPIDLMILRCWDSFVLVYGIEGISFPGLKSWSIAAAAECVAMLTFSPHVRDRDAENKPALFKKRLRRLGLRREQPTLVTRAHYSFRSESLTHSLTTTPPLEQVGGRETRPHLSPDNSTAKSFTAASDSNGRNGSTRHRAR
jgi:hypothetical protein